MDIFEIIAMFGIPLTLGGIIGLLVQTILTAVIIIIVAKIIAHEVDPKHVLIMAFAAYFLAPLLMTALALVGIVLTSYLVIYIIPLVLWIVLGEMLLSGDVKNKLIVAFVSFVVYIVLLIYVKLPLIISAMIPF